MNNFAANTGQFYKQPIIRDCASKINDVKYFKNIYSELAYKHDRPFQIYQEHITDINKLFRNPYGLFCCIRFPELWPALIVRRVEFGFRV